jgi:hypothetical protein
VVDDDGIERELISRKEAKEKELLYYFTGKPCPKNHISLKLVSSFGCKKCASERSSEKTEKIRIEKFLRIKKEQDLPRRTASDDYGVEQEIISRSEAKRQSLIYYFTGKPCIHGHVGLRRVHNHECTICIQLHGKKWRENNPGYATKIMRDFVDKNPNWFKEYYWRDPGRRSEWHKKWMSQNPDKVYTYNSNRRALKISATPGWYDEAKVEEIFAECIKISKESGIKHNVDHIVPLNSPYVCGLHWHGNLQILTQVENFSKLNRYWPDMSEITLELKQIAREFKLTCDQNSANLSNPIKND